MEYGAGEGTNARRKTPGEFWGKIKRVENIHILPTMLKGIVQNAIKYPYELRSGEEFCFIYTDSAAHEPS
jgi:hypothetical protein